MLHPPFLSLIPRPYLLVILLGESVTTGRTAPSIHQANILSRAWRASVADSKKVSRSAQTAKGMFTSPHGLFPPPWLRVFRAFFFIGYLVSMRSSSVPAIFMSTPACLVQR